MAKKSSWNPIAFVPTQVTLISTAVYIALFTILIWVNNTVPSAPKSSTPVDGVNLTQTWLDLSRITDGYHPIDSRKNGEVKAYLLQRIEEILEQIGVVEDGRCGAGCALQDEVCEVEVRGEGIHSQ